MQWIETLLQEQSENAAVEFQSLRDLAVVDYRGIEFFSVTARWGASLTDRAKTSGRA